MMAATPKTEPAEARFRELYHLNVEAVRRYVWRRDPMLVDDVVAETFLTAWRRLDEIPVNASAWLIVVARNTLLNEHRRERRQAAVTDRLAAEPSRSMGESQTSTSDLVDVAFSMLSEDDREILTLSIWDDLDRGAIAAVLGCSKANVSVRLHRARRRFAVELADLQRESGPLLHPATFTGGVDG